MPKADLLEFRRVLNSYFSEGVEVKRALVSRELFDEIYDALKANEQETGKWRRWIDAEGGIMFKGVSCQVNDNLRANEFVVEIP